MSLDHLARNGAVAPAVPATLPPHLPDVLLGLFERRYLNDFDASRWTLRPWPDDTGRPVLAEVEAIGRTPAGEPWAAAMPHVLTACHSRGHAVVMTVHGDGQRHRILLGGRRMPGAAEGSTQDYLEGQAAVLRGHVPGLVLGPPGRLGDGGPGGGHSDVARQIREAPSFAVLTGVPSVRGDGAAAALFQSVEQLVAATGTHRYTLTVVAEPLPEQVLDDTIRTCRRLRSEVSGLIQQTVGHSTAESDAVSETVQQAPEFTELLPMLAFAGFAGVLLPGAGASPLGMLPLTLSLGGMLLGSGDRNSTGTQVTHTRGESTSTVLLDAVAQACDQYLEQHVQRLQRARSHGWWRAAVYVAADSDAGLHAVTSAVRSITSGETTSVDPVRVVTPPSWYVRSAMLRGQILAMRPADGSPGHPLGVPYDALATCVGSTELAILVNLPRRNVPGLQIRDVGEFALSAPAPTEKSIELGHLLDGQQRELAPVTLTADALNRHLFIGGMTGYGKTTTAMNLLVAARSRLEVPFLVIEPVKAEYRALQRIAALPGHLTVYTVGEETARDRRTGTTSLPLRLNPFEPVGNVSLGRHLDLLKGVFNASFPMGPGMPQILEDAIEQVYKDYGWNLDTSQNDVLGPYPHREDRAALAPTIADVAAKIDTVLAEKKYAGEILANLGAALRSRLRSLTLGTKGMTLDTRRSVPPEDLFDRPVVIELSNLGDDEEKAFVMALLLCRLYEYAEARHQDRPRPGLRHLTLIEEAHRLLRSPRADGGPESADPQAKAVSMFTDLLAEMRSYGEGFVVADQVPTKLTPDVLKNSNIKILHRLVAPDDRAAAGGTINLTEPQSRHLAGLTRGVAVVHDDELGAATLVKMHALDLEPVGGPVPDRPQDRGYLLRSSACRHCPAPCTLQSPNLRHRDGHTLATDIGRILEEAVADGRPDAAWTAWTAWRARWADGSPEAREAAVYCAATQAAADWLSAQALRRARAVGLAAAPAAARLGIHRLGPAVADFVQAWQRADTLDDPARAAAEALRRGIAADATRPPLEMVGCRACPVRCRALADVADAGPKERTEVVIRAGSAVPPETRLRAIRTQVRGLLGAGEVTENRELAATYCLLTLSAHRTAVDLTDLLDRCRAELTAEPPAG
jgi:Helicase HerA, central domain